MTSPATCALMSPLFNRPTTIEATALPPKSATPGFARLTPAPRLINRDEGSFLFPFLSLFFVFSAPPTSELRRRCRLLHRPGRCIDLFRSEKCGGPPHQLQLR